MQNAKDSFYLVLRNRLAVLNPARRIQVRGVTRPGIVVEEAEAPMAEPLPDVFTLRWAGLTAMEELPSMLCGMVCEVLYSTSGSQGNAGLDRGRAMAQMDRELLDLLTPMYTPKVDYTATPSVTMQTNVFWTEPVAKPSVVKRDLLSRVVTVTVFEFEEPGEL
jgi:hypothetical protein